MNRSSVCFWLAALGLILTTPLATLLCTVCSPRLHVPPLPQHWTATMIVPSPQHSWPCWALKGLLVCRAVGADVRFTFLTH